MQRSTIFAALSALALGGLTGCAADRTATEVPSGTNPEALPETTANAGPEQMPAQEEVALPSAGSPELGASVGDSPATSTADQEPEPTADAQGDPGATDPLAAKTETPKPQKNKKKAKPKKKRSRASKGEAKCGEGTCA